MHLKTTWSTQLTNEKLEKLEIIDNKLYYTKFENRQTFILNCHTNPGKIAVVTAGEWTDSCELPDNMRDSWTITMHLLRKAPTRIIPAVVYKRYPHRIKLVKHIIIPGIGLEQSVKPANSERTEILHGKGPYAAAIIKRPNNKSSSNTYMTLQVLECGFQLLFALELVIVMILIGYNKKRSKRNTKILRQYVSETAV